MKQRAGSLKDHKSNKILIRLAKKKKKTEVTNVRNEIGDFIADVPDSKRIT